MLNFTLLINSIILHKKNNPIILIVKKYNISIINVNY